ncbi:MAG: citrate synthase [Deltaproteobacteria bacterium]|nr:citrate synthase [Deltaproteobacteria bacterium]
MTDFASIKYGEKEWIYPIIEGSEGERAIDISELRSDSGLVAYDPSYSNFAVCKSAITYIDGESGILRYRGIPIEELVKRPDFVEVAWLLIFGHKPEKDERERFRKRLTKNAHLPERMRHHFEGFPATAHPMAVTSAMINALSCFYPELFNSEWDVEFEEISAELISKIRTIAAYAYRRSKGLPYIYPDPKLRYCANFLHMLFSMPYDQYVADPEIEDALNLLFILHADHEQNCSTSTVRIVGSSQANLFASCAAGVCALWGRLHGGANVAVMEMLQQIHDGELTVKQYIEKAKQKDSGCKLMGFGHRIYKNYDPRARILKASCHRVLQKLQISDPLLDIALQLEEAALEDPYFTERKLYPNVDFYSGIIFRAIGIPTDMFTVMFVIGRLPGWIAHWHEQREDPTLRIARPRQIYTGPTPTSGQNCAEKI